MANGKITRRTALGLIGVGGALTISETFGFTNVTAGRGISVNASDDPKAIVGLTDNSGSTDANIQNSNDESLLYYLDDNADEFSSADAFSADVIAFDGSSTDLEATVKADDGSHDFVLVVTCSSSDLNAQGTPTVDVVADTEDVRVELQRTTENQINVNCRSGGNPGSGFDSVYASNVSGFVQPSEERQTFRFVLAGNRQPDEQIEIDLSDPQAGGVDYNGDVQIESGQGNVWVSTSAITYQVSSEDGNGDEIVLSVGSYSTDGIGGPYDVTFTRVGTGEVGTDQFWIDGEEGTDEPFMDVTAEDVPANAGSNGERQTFRFTPGQSIEAWEEVQIDLGNAQGNGVNYGWNASVEQGDGNAWRSGDTGMLVYHVNPDDYAGEEIVVSIDLTDTDGSGGPYSVTFTRTDTGDQDSDTFGID